MTWFVMIRYLVYNYQGDVLNLGKINFCFEYF